MLFSLLSLAQIRPLKPESEPKRNVLEDTASSKPENCEKITGQSVKELAFTPSSNFYCFTTEFSFYIDGYSTVTEYYYSRKDLYKNYFFIHLSSETTYSISHTFITNEDKYTINLFFEPEEISKLPDSSQKYKNKYVINKNFDDVIYSRYQYNSAGELDTSDSSGTNIDYVVVLGKKGMNIKVASDAEIKPIGTTSASIKDGYTLQKPELLIFNIEPPEDKQVANEIVDIKMKVTITGHTSIVSNYNCYKTDSYSINFEEIDSQEYTKPFIYTKGELAKLGDTFYDCNELEDYTHYTPNIISKRTTETKNFCFKAKNSFVIMQPNTVLYSKIYWSNFISKYENILAFKCNSEYYFKIELETIKEVDIQFLPKNEEYEKTNYYIISKSGDYSITSRYVIKDKMIYQYNDDRNPDVKTYVDTVVVLGKDSLNVKATPKSESAIIKEYDSSGVKTKSEIEYENSGSIAFHGTIDIENADDDTYNMNIALSVSNTDISSIPNFYFDNDNYQIYYDKVKEKQPRDYSRGELVFLSSEFDECSDLEYIGDYSNSNEKLEFSSSKKSICIKTNFGFLIDKKGVNIYQYYIDQSDGISINYYQNILAVYGADSFYYETIYYKIIYSAKLQETTTVNMYLLPKSDGSSYNNYYIICNNFDGSIYSRLDPGKMDFYDYVVVPGSKGTKVKITKDENYALTDLNVFTSDESKVEAVQSSSGYTHESDEVTSAFGDTLGSHNPDKAEYTRINVKVTNQAISGFPKLNFYLKEEDILTYDNVSGTVPYDYSKGFKVLLPKEFEDCDEFEENLYISKTVEFTPTKQTYCFMNRGFLLVEGKGITIYRSCLFGKETTITKNAFAVRRPIEDSGGKNFNPYFYKLSFKTTKESEKFNVHSPWFRGKKPYLILGSSFEGVLSPEEDEGYTSIIIFGDEGRNVKKYTDDTSDYLLTFSGLDQDENEEKESLIKEKVASEEGYTFPQNQYLGVFHEEKCRIKVTGKRIEAFPNTNFYLESDLTYEQVEELVEENNKLGGGAIAGIVIACIVVVAVVCALVWWLKFYNNTEEVKNNEENEKAEEGKNEEFYVDKSNTEV